MNVLKSDVDKVVTRLKLEDSTIKSVNDLIGKTLELSKGPGTGVILDPSRPQDVFDRFWLITNIAPETAMRPNTSTPRCSE